MSHSTSVQTRLTAHFLAHQRAWVCALLLGWALVQILLLATSSFMEARRYHNTLAFWEPLTWEASSVLIVLLCIAPIVRIHQYLRGRMGAVWLVLTHAGLTLVFSLLHVAGMVGIRKGVYWLMGEHYHFGNLGYELLYEYRKDAMAYVIILAVASCYQFIVRRLQGEASYMAESEHSSRPLPDRLLVKKLGKEFLLAVADIRWIEASGNYANLYVNGSVYPMRITMAKLAALLPAQFVRVHRSYIVNVQAIDHIQPGDNGDYHIGLHSGETLPLSRRYRDAFRDGIYPAAPFEP